MKRIIIMLAALAALAVPATASAQGYWTSNHFYSPSRHTECRFKPATYPYAYIACENFDTRQVAVIYQRGKAVNVVDDIGAARRMFDRWGAGPTLEYGQTYKSGAGLRCYAQTNADSASPAMECWSTYSGHGFLINRYGIRRF
jgi:hypothetical protein